MVVAFTIGMTGCGTTTQRLATEQMLVSDAVDQAISQIDFSTLSNQKVFMDTSYLKPIRGMGFVNADYIISALRQQLTAARCLIQDDRESADIIIEPRVGALGTDGHEVTYGLPQSTAIQTAAAAFSSSPVPAFPEVSFGKVDAQSGIAKVIVFAFERETKQPVWQSGVAKAESSSNNTWILGAGPFQKGTIYDDVRFAGKAINRPPVGPFAENQSGYASKDRSDGRDSKFSNRIHERSLAYDQPYIFENVKPASKTLTAESEPSADNKVKTASHEEDVKEGK